jgi:thiosulfate dehydrogenase (quinone) large subunit
MSRDLSTAYVILRVTMGLNMLFHGLPRIGHLAQFVDGVVKSFGKTPLPPMLIAPYAYAIPFVEIVLGILILAGAGLRYVLPLSAIYIMTLMVGTLFRADYLVVSEQLGYTLLFVLLIAGRSYDRFSYDLAAKKR